MPQPPRPANHERRILLYCLLGGLPGVVATALLLAEGEYSTRTWVTVALVVVGCWLGFAFAVRERVIYPLRTLANLLAAIREGDFSLRARSAKHDALGEVMDEANLMGQMLREQRLQAMETANLFRRVMETIDVAIFAFDAKGRLRLVNRAGEHLQQKPLERLMDLPADELRLEECLAGPQPRTVEMAFPGGTGRWRMSRRTFRERGEPHQMVVLSDLTRELREEELQAWQRLVRVLGHEINNSLAPMKSIAGSLRSVVRQAGVEGEAREDVEEGLDVIASRVDALSRFTGAYARLAKLPEIQPEPVDVGGLIGRAVKLETRLDVGVTPGPEASIHADAAQVEQALINLIQNGVDAAKETGGGVDVSWRKNGAGLEIVVADDGPGLSSNANLFVPFFTTKPGGSGIGLVLSRRIAENHGGTLTLRNRTGGKGCEAQLRLPLEPHARDGEARGRVLR